MVFHLLRYDVTYLKTGLGGPWFVSEMFALFLAFRMSVLSAMSFCVFDLRRPCWLGFSWCKWRRSWQLYLCCPWSPRCSWFPSSPWLQLFPWFCYVHDFSAIRDVHVEWDIPDGMSVKIQENMLCRHCPWFPRCLRFPKFHHFPDYRDFNAISCVQDSVMFMV